MKTIKSILIVMFTLSTAQIASAYYCPSDGRWLSRDPNGEPGFENLRAASTVPRVGQIAGSPSMPQGRWIERDSFNSGPNSYDSVGNDPLSFSDPLGLAYGNPVSGPDGPVGPSDPFAPGGPFGPVYNPQVSCKEACFYKYVLGITVSSTLVVSGQPILEKRFVAVDSAEAPSRIIVARKTLIFDV